MIEAPTSGLRGRALIYPILVIAGWGIGRAFALHSQPSSSVSDYTEIVPKTQQTAFRIPDTSLARLFWPAIRGGPVSDPRPIRMIPPTISNSRAINTAVRGERWLPNPSLPSAPTAETNIPEESPFTQLAVAAPPLPPALPPAMLLTAPSRRRMQLYGYSLWRQGSGSGTFAPGAQYGGSQAGLIATWDPFGRAGKGVALLARASATPDGNERELALGTRWQPNRRWPISLSAERRIRLNGQDGFAFYAAGGVSDVAIVGKAKLDAFGQAGYVSGKDGGGFFDAHGRLLHPAATLAGLPLSAGAGAWAGGQPGVRRLDVGPTIATRVETRFADFILQLDWRQRVAGNANPKDGLALTVSTDF